MEKQTKKPKLRFPEFKGEWEKKKLREVAPLQRGFDLPVDNIKIGEFPVVFSNGILKYHNEFKAKAPGVVTGRSGTIGKVTFVEKDYWPHNTSLWVTDFKGNYPKFIFYFYSKYNLERFGTGSGVPTLNRNDVHIQEDFFPTLHEQTKIAEFFSAIDAKIQALKTKKEKLQQYKKGVMQQLFSQELRFKDDDSKEFPKWEMKKLGEVCEVTIGEFVIKTKQNPNGKYPVFNGGKTYTGLYDEFNNEGNKIIISARGANAGFVNFQLEKYWAGNSCYSICTKDDKIHSIKYFYFFVKMFENRFLENQQAANIPSVSKKDAENFEIQIPSLPEQTQIANFLSSIDEKINHTETQIQQTQSWKKGLLQNMFI